jgi:hypothetical protein
MGADHNRAPCTVTVVKLSICRVGFPIPPRYYGLACVPLCQGGGVFFVVVLGWHSRWGFLFWLGWCHCVMVLGVGWGLF